MVVSGRNTLALPFPKTLPPDREHCLAGAGKAVPHFFIVVPRVVAGVYGAVSGAGQTLCPVREGIAIVESLAVTLPVVSPLSYAASTVISCNSDFRNSRVSGQ